MILKYLSIKLITKQITKTLNRLSSYISKFQNQVNIHLYKIRLLHYHYSSFFFIVSCLELSALLQGL